MSYQSDVDSLGNEIWKPVVGAPHYEVSDQGRVRSYYTLGGGKFGSWVTSTPTVLKYGHHATGYPKYILRFESGRKTVTAGSLVLAAFVGPCPAGMQVCHNNGKPLDNRLDNLRYDTPKANQEDRKKHGTDIKGEQVHSAKLTECQVLEILFRHQAGEAIRSLARAYNVRQGTIQRIVRRIGWTHVRIQ